MRRCCDGEEVGKGDGPEVDIAVDPIEGEDGGDRAEQCAGSHGLRPPRGSLLHAPDMYKNWLLIGWQRARLICLCP